MPHLLIIDDDVMLLKLLKDHFTEEGYEVTTAAFAQEGLQKALDRRPDLVLLDLMLPDGTGYQTCIRLRRNLETHSTPIIMMSSVARLPSQHAIGRLMGANAYMVKPLNLIETGDCVRALLNCTLPVDQLPARPNHNVVA
jgi:DNA-binding response OmpR family regulator